jgi:hypothetical protein
MSAPLVQIFLTCINFCSWLFRLFGSWLIFIRMEFLGIVSNVCNWRCVIYNLKFDLLNSSLLQVTSCYGLLATESIGVPVATGRSVTVPFHPGYRYVAFQARTSDEVGIFDLYWLHDQSNIIGWSCQPLWWTARYASVSWSLLSCF